VLPVLADPSRTTEVFLVAPPCRAGAAWVTSPVSAAPVNTLGDECGRIAPVNTCASPSNARALTRASGNSMIRTMQCKLHDYPGGW
jgi:hypothetical protein